MKRARGNDPGLKPLIFSYFVGLKPHANPERQGQEQPQIPGACSRTYGDDKQKGNNKDNSRFPSGMTTKRQLQKPKGNGKIVGASSWGKAL